MRRARGPFTRRLRRVALAAVALLVGALTVALPAPAQADPIVPLTISFTKIVQYGTDVDPGLTQGPVGDFYAHVQIGGGPVLSTFDNRFDYGFEFGVGYIFPFTLTPPPSWSLTQDVDAAGGPVNVHLELWDEDDINDDDLVDIGPTGAESADISVDPTTGRWTGDVSWPQNCVMGSGGEQVELCFEISTISGNGDADGDALLDAWEQNGINVDGDTDIDVDLPALGANPRRKDLFVEVDCLVDDANADGDTVDAADHSHCPTAGALNPVVQGFANAPLSNPDGTSGIALHLDTGTLYGGGVSTVAGASGVSGTIGDLGSGGTRIAESGNETIDWDGGGGATRFYDLKALNFNTQRADAFRYVIFAHQVNARSSSNDCTSGWAEDIRGNDFIVSLGGRRDLDGNGTADTTCWRQDSATNTVDDDGDGAVDEDRPDNMDNDGDCSDDTDDDGNVCDFGDVGVDEDGGDSIGSPTQQAGTFMHEFGHVLGLRHGGGDDTNDKPNYLSTMNYSFQSCGVPMSGPGASTALPGGCDFSRIDLDLDENSLDECVGVGTAVGLGRMDWNGNSVFQGVSNCQPPNSANVAADINDDDGRGALNGFDDWNNLAFEYRSLSSFGDDGAIHPVNDEPDPSTVEQAIEALDGRTTPHLALHVNGPAIVLPGETISYTVTTESDGDGPAVDTRLDIERPNGTAEQADVGTLPVGASDSRQVSYTVPADACPSTLTTSAEATYRGMADVERTERAHADTQVLDVTAPTITVSPSPDTLWPPNHKMNDITVDVTVHDECDPNPTVTLKSITHDQLGSGSIADDVEGVALGTDDRAFKVRAERDGNKKDGRTYTAVYEVRDSSGNTREAVATVKVPHSKPK